ncbi:MAG: HK97 family phage prohead protease [Novosphingobium sp.]
MTMTLVAPQGRPEPSAGVRFAGYAALFRRADAGGDVILPGAFRRSLAARRAAGEPLPLFWQHRPEQQIGWVERCEEDERGLRVIARLAAPEGARAALLREREVSGLSFGYRAKAYRPIALAGGRQGRELADVEIFEISLVTVPMQPAARVHLVM